MLKTLILKGQAAKKFGKKHQFHVTDLKELIRAMCYQVPGFRKYLATAHHDGIHFAFFSGHDNLSLEAFDLTQTATEFTLRPIPRGAKNSGLTQVLIGAAVIGAAFLAPVALAGLGAMAATASTALMGMGIAMSLGGVVQMLTPQPNYHVGASSSADNKPNYAFGAPVNTVAMGYPVPLLYGEREVGGAIISAGIFSSDQQ